MTYQEYVSEGMYLIEQILTKNGRSLLSAMNGNEARRQSADAETEFLEQVKSLLTYERTAWIEDDNENVTVFDTETKNSVESLWIGKTTISGYGTAYVAIPSNPRYWNDIAILGRSGNYYPINLKFTAGENADNLFGVKTLNYLLFGCGNRSYGGIDFPYHKPNESSLAERIASIALNEGLESFYRKSPIRDYFILSIRKNDMVMKAVPFLAIPERYVLTNPKNGFQLNSFSEHVCDEFEYDFVKNMKKLVRLYFEYAEKKAQPYIAISKAKNSILN